MEKKDCDNRCNLHLQYDGIFLTLRINYNSLNDNFNNFAAHFDMKISFFLEWNFKMLHKI